MMILNNEFSFKSLSSIGVILVGIIGVLALTGSGGGSDNGDDGTPPPDDPPPVFSVAPVDITYRPSTGRYGQIDPDSPMMLPFGARLETGVLSPAIEYFTLLNVDVRASAGGVVVGVNRNPAPQTDFEIHIKPFEESRYLVVYDHIKNPAISQGDSTRILHAPDWFAHGKSKGAAVLSIPQTLVFAVSRPIRERPSG